MLDRLSLYAAVISAIVTIASFFFVWTFEVPAFKFAGFEFGKYVNIDDNKQFDYNNYIKQMEDRLISLESHISNINELPDEIAVSQRISAIEHDIKSLRKSMNNIESAILDSPEKAIAIPLLRKDVDNNREYMQDGLLILRNELIRSNETMRWFAGTIVIGILGLVINAFIRK